jgi:hypothetical protein
MLRTKDELVPILFRYFMAASLMRQEFDRHLRDPKDAERVSSHPMLFLTSKAGLTMCLWYGMLIRCARRMAGGETLGPGSRSIDFLAEYRTATTISQRDVSLSIGLLAAQQVFRLLRTKGEDGGVGPSTYNRVWSLSDSEYEKDLARNCRKVRMGAWLCGRDVGRLSYPSR